MEEKNKVEKEIISPKKQAEFILNHALNEIINKTGMSIAPGIQLVFDVSEATEEQKEIAKSYEVKLKEKLKEKKDGK